ncbi:MAG TPA: glutamate--cysteine ligase [Acidiferrobacteraceae bacterium]|nr:glutamate--cysteine ligase [Acidiferrobacteraceae bacterium]
MGQEIASSHFSEQDFEQFNERLGAETTLLSDWFKQGRFAPAEPTGGFELEVWLVDKHLRPAPINAAFLERYGDIDAVPELSRFNIELNTTPLVLNQAALAAMHRELDDTLKNCTHTAAELDARLAIIGILPTVGNADLTVANMSDMERYRALNEQVLRMRQGRPIELDIEGRERLQTSHSDVMLEAATTSFQIHLQADPSQMVRAYNAAMIASAPMVALSANSPYLFGKDLWDETRIPLFEQSVTTQSPKASARSASRRVTFGSGYIQNSVLELFEENLEKYPVLLPDAQETAAEELCHVCLHNGTLWRWNRVLIGFSDEGEPTLRIEHRVVPAGPTISDAIANAALLFGLVQDLSTQEVAPEKVLTFEDARSNFYAAARHGLQAELKWLGGPKQGARKLILDYLLPRARRGLLSLGIDRLDAEKYIDIIHRRVDSGQTGAHWQREFIKKHQCSMAQMTAAYLERQEQGRPVHEWPL